jgi:hypothetical protein
LRPELTRIKGTNTHKDLAMGYLKNFSSNKFTC